MQIQIANYQESSPINIFSAAVQLAKDAEIFAYIVTLLKEENKILWKANKALSKRWKAKRIHLQDRRLLSIEVGAGDSPSGGVLGRSGV